MKRFAVTVEVTETYEILIDAEDSDEVCSAVYDMPICDILTDGSPKNSEVEVQDFEEIPFIRED